MDEYGEEEDETQHSLDQDTTDETHNSDSKIRRNDLKSDDSDDGTEVDTFEETKNSDKGNDSELIDSDVNIEATELSSSDQDMSDESDLKGDVSSDVESNPNSMKELAKNDRNESGKLESDEEETFELELKDGKEDSADEESDKVDREESRVNASDMVECKTGSADIESDEIKQLGETRKAENIADEEVLQLEKTEEIIQKPSVSVCDTEVKSIINDGNLKTETDEIKCESTEINSKVNASEENLKTNSNDESVDAPMSSEHLESQFQEKSESTVETSNVRQLNCSDSSDDISDFIGFDTTVANETIQIYHILLENHEELAKRKQNSETKDTSDSAMDVDECFNSEPSVTLSNAVSGHVYAMENDAVIGEATQEYRSPEEQIANNSKRIKKKRKFFDEFDESEVEPPKKPHLMKERENNSNMTNSLSENKENFMTAEKLSVKDETLSETTATSSAFASSTPNPPRTETKGRFDISNPDFKEPFKYGWKREVVYRFISEDGRKRSADVSYFTPQGKKLRSIKQINEHLPNDGSLHVRNFTFSKELVFPNRDSELEITRFTKKIEMELLTNESEINDNVIDKKLGIEVAASEDQMKSDSSKKSISKKKEVQIKSKSNAKNVSLQGTELSATKSKSSKKLKNSDADVEESSNATPKLAMPKILLRGPSVNSNSTPKSVTSKLPTIKTKLSTSKLNNQKNVKKVSKPKSEKNSKSQKRADDLETSMLPSDWKTSDQRNLSPGSKAASNSSVSSNSNINGGSPSEINAYQSDSHVLDYPSSFTLSNISRIYDPLLMSLRYLTVRDLLRVSMTSKFLNRVASDPYLWKTVRLRNSQVHDWNGFAIALQKYGTKRLDMRKMLCSSSPDDLTKMWNSFLEVIPSITSLEHIDFSRAPTSVVDSVAATCINLSIINALYLRNGSLQLENFANMKHLTELRLKGVSGIQLERSELRLQFINKENLREISLTSVRNLDMDMLKMISEATNLVTLELGECTKLPAEFANDTITKLTKLEKLRLEKLEDLAPKYDIFAVIKDMSNLKYLELINIEVKEGFDDALGLCKNLEHFLIIPTYVSQSATTNQLIINGIKRLSDTMKSFVWGLTLELLKVTDLFMDQWQQKGNNSGTVKKAVGDSIPILKAVDKLPSDGDTVPTHVDILPVPKLEKMLITLLPNSRVKVIKIPFQMTWRQCLSECLK